MIRIFYSILIFAFVSILPVHSESVNLTKTDIQFTVIHPFKTVIGQCKGTVVSPVQFQRNADGLAAPKTLKIEVPIKEIRSGDENRDEHISEALGYPVHSQITFQLGSIATSKEEWTISGNLTVNGITKPVKSQAKVRYEGQEIFISGKFQVLMSDFEVVAPSLLFTTAKNEVSIEYSFILKP